MKTLLLNNVGQVCRETGKGVSLGSPRRAPDNTHSLRTPPKWGALQRGAGETPPG